MDNQVEISVVIVSYNACGVIGTCIDSVVDIDDAEKEIFVVDNASTDGSAEFHQDELPFCQSYRERKEHGFCGSRQPCPDIL